MIAASYRPLRALASSFAVSLLFVAQPTGAAELVMFERTGCIFCARFDREIAPIYARTPGARVAPLRRVDIDRPIPADLRFIEIERLTPVFVLVEGGREVGRIRGYTGEESFWALFAGLFQRLKAPAAAN